MWKSLLTRTLKFVFYSNFTNAFSPYLKYYNSRLKCEWQISGIRLIFANILLASVIPFSGITINSSNIFFIQKYFFHTIILSKPVIDMNYLKDLWWLTCGHWECSCVSYVWAAFSGDFILWANINIESLRKFLTNLVKDPNIVIYTYT